MSHILLFNIIVNREQKGSKSLLLGSGGGNIGCSSAIELSLRWRQGAVQWE